MGRGPLPDRSVTRPHWAMSFGRVRRYVSLLRPVMLSTVSAITLDPAASTRFNNASLASQEFGA